MLYIIIIISILFVAYTNGANDNFKGVATLFGTGTTDYKKAISWATITTAAGSIASIFLAAELVKNFSGKGLVPDDLIATPAFVVAVGLGAALTVFLATKIGMPVSTTHGLVGALTGVGLTAVGSAFNFEKLGKTFFLPLIVSPFLALAISVAVYYIFKRLLENINEKSPKTLEILHFISAGIVSFARGLNDTPKIVALLLIVSWLDIKVAMLLVAVFIALGGWFNAAKIAETMSKKITTMSNEQGFSANLVTSLLVTTASYHGLPVSTTHVSVGSLFGIGLLTKTANVKTIRNILLSWVLTLPLAAIISGLVYLILTKIVQI
jgi:inorganic phosphate transporter, PiT family